MFEALPTFELSSMEDLILSEKEFLKCLLRVMNKDYSLKDTNNNQFC